MPRDRDWTLALKKCVVEGECRLCRRGSPDPAHIIGRVHDPRHRSLRGYSDMGGTRKPRDVRVVLADAIVPLCRSCHTAYDEHRQPILAVLHVDEIARAVFDAGGLVPMLYRTLSVDHSHDLDSRVAEYLTRSAERPAMIP